MAAKPIFQNIAILGVGLIGGSIGAAVAARRLASEIVGIDRDPKNLRAARQQGAICRGTTQLERGVSKADLVLVCTPIETIVDRVAAVAAATEKPCLIADVGSTKARIVAAVGRNAAAADRFVGSHPMAGNEQQGPRHADKNLFLGRSVILTPIRNTNRTALRRLERFWSSLGARTVTMSPAEHDRSIATVSHLPHLVAAALVASTPDRNLAQVASGWLDTTRIASSDAEMWVHILRDNRSHILKSATRFEKVVTSMCRALAEEDRATLCKILQDAQAKRDSAGSSHS